MDIWSNQCLKMTQRLARYFVSQFFNTKIMSFNHQKCNLFVTCWFASRWGGSTSWKRSTCWGCAQRGRHSWEDAHKFEKCWVSFSKRWASTSEPSTCWRCLSRATLRRRNLELSELPASPLPTEIELHIRDAEEKKFQKLENIAFPSLDDTKHSNLMHQEVPLPPSLPLAEDVLCMGHSNENMCADIRFLEPDDEVTYFMSQPVVMACDVPLPPSPSPDNAAHHGRSFQEKKHPDLFFHVFCFSWCRSAWSVASQPAEIPLPSKPSTSWHCVGQGAQWWQEMPKPVKHDEDDDI